LYSGISNLVNKNISDSVNQLSSQIDCVLTYKNDSKIHHDDNNHDGTNNTVKHDSNKLTLRQQREKFQNYLITKQSLKLQTYVSDHKKETFILIFILQRLQLRISLNLFLLTLHSKLFW
jgi:hypothetical protein